MALIMLNSGDPRAGRRPRLLTAAGFFTAAPPIAGLMLFGAPSVTPGLAPPQQQPQAQSAPADPPPAYVYDEVTFKPSKGRVPRGRLGISNEPDGLQAWNVTPQQLISSAYGVDRFHITGGPDWLASDHYDVDAKIGSAVDEALHKLGRDARPQVRQQMLQALLASSLKLAVHHENKDLPVYFLAIAQSGPKLQDAKPGENPARAGRGGRGGFAGNGTVRITGKGKQTFRAAPISALINLLAREVDRPVLNKTALAGRYDFKLNWTPDYSRVKAPQVGAPGRASRIPPPEANNPSLFIALQQQLGLELQSGTAPYDALVIDHVERPNAH